MVSAWIVSGLLLAAGAARGEVTVDANLPAGNVIVESVAGDTVRVRQDLRDTKGNWFYWAFRVKGAAGRTLTFDFTDKKYGGGPVGVRGPVVSTDGGKTFSYPLDRRSRTDGFTYTFGTGEDDVLFYECHPYVRAIRLHRPGRTGLQFGCRPCRPEVPHLHERAAPLLRDDGELGLGGRGRGVPRG